MDKHPRPAADVDAARPHMDADLLVVGAGMAGMTAAARAADRGARAVVIERAPSYGGSAVLSGGVLWTAESVEALAADDPNGNGVLGRLLVERYADLLDWVRVSGADVGPCVPVLYGRGHRIDIVGYLRWCARKITDSGGWVLTERTVSRLRAEDGRVRGALVADRDGEAVIESVASVLATGGFQASRQLRDRHFGPGASNGLLLRSNPYSDGQGLALAEAEGAAHTTGMSRFYGHLVAGPTPTFGERDFARLATVFSERTLLFDSAGRRFVDESRGDHHSAQACASRPDARCLLLMDDVLNEEISHNPNVPGGESVDRVAEARAAGAPTGAATTLEELAAEANRMGFDGSNVVDSLVLFNRAMRTGDQPPDVPRAQHRREMSMRPWHLIALVPAITFTQGGLQIDEQARVLDTAGRHMPGLLAAGADVGVFGGGYGGGLCLAGVTGLIAAENSDLLAR